MTTVCPCGKPRTPGARWGCRGMCVACYSRSQYLERHPGARSYSPTTAEMIHELRDQGFDDEFIARDLGIKMASLKRALLREKQGSST